MKKKKFRLFDAILATICITLVAESVPPTAAIGNSQYFWWIFLIFAFCLPYGLVTAELGSTFNSEGGMYDWVKKAFGKKMAARVAWNYWINFPLWISSLAVAVTDVIAGIFEINLSIPWLLALQLIYVVLVTFLGTQRIGESKYIVNIGTFFKIIFMLSLGILGVYVFAKTGQSANPVTSLTDLFPSLDLAGLSFISVIIFNFLGFEVVATFTDDMKKPKREIPKAIIIGGIMMAIFYILPATGINIAMTTQDAQASGITESFAILLTSLGVSTAVIRSLVVLIGLMFIYTMVANIVAWSFGVNSMARYSANDGGLPKIFAKTNKKGVSISTSLITGGVAALVCIIGIIIGVLSESASNLFWTFFSFSLVTFLMSYIPLFPTFIKLRKIDNTPRSYKMPGSIGLIKVICSFSMLLLLLGIIFTVFIDFTWDSILANLPLIIGLGVSIIIQEILVSRVKNDQEV